MYITHRQAQITVTIDGTAVDGGGVTASWATAQGGQLSANDTKTRPGGMGSEVAVGGHSSRDDLTVTTQWTDTMAALEQGLEDKVGSGVMTVTIAWLQKDGSVVGKGDKTINGVLKSVKQPDADHNSSETGMLTLVMSCDEKAANVKSS